MGYMRHYSMVVTGYGEQIQQAHAEARKIFDNVSPLMSSYVNGYQTFLVPSDGSKLGWPDANDAAQRRERFKLWLYGQAYDDGSSPFDWVEVLYGDDENLVAIVAHDGGEVR